MELSYKLNGNTIDRETAVAIARATKKFDEFVEVANDVIADEYDLDEVLITADLTIEISRL